MQLVVLALLGCCVVAHSASLSDTLSVPKTVLEEGSADLESLESSTFELNTPEDSVREKRSGSGGFLSAIGSAILGKVAQASSGISKGSSDGSYSSGRGEHHEYETVEYGPPVHGHDESNFDIWSFKKAILNTLFQALKAIGGGVIALKGKLIKGGGIVVSAKGNIISAKGEAISHLGRQIAASAILTPPKTEHSYGGYETPVHHVTSDHNSYAGPPPSAYVSHGGYAAPSAGSSDSYGHSGYASPSDDAENPGLVIVKSLNGENTGHGHDEHQTSYGSLLQSGGGGGLSELVESIKEKKSSALKNIVSKIASTLNSGVLKNLPKKLESTKTPGINYDGSHSVEHVEHKENHPGLNYGPATFDHGIAQSLPIQESHIIHKDESSSGGSGGGVYLDGEKLNSVTGHHGSFGNGADNNNAHISYQQYKNQNENENYSSDFGAGLHDGIANQYSQNYDNYAGGEAGAAGISENGQHFMLAVGPPAELQIPILQSANNQQPLYFSQSAHNNQLQNFNNYNGHSYNGILRRNGVRQNNRDIQIIPSIGYAFKNSRVYRI